MTIFEAIDIVYKHVNNSSYKNEVKGKGYKITRPSKAHPEDWVVNAITLNNEQLQRGMLNFNQHLPFLKLRINGVESIDQIDFVRANVLAQKAEEVLKEVWDPEGNYTFGIQQHGLITDPENQEAYINFRISFFNINISN